MERLISLYAYGNSAVEIFKILSQEFDDVEVNPIRLADVKNVIKMQKAELDLAKQELSTLCRDAMQKQMLSLYERGNAIEAKIFDRYTRKMEEMMDRLDDIDLAEPDPEGSNLKTYFSLITAIEKTHQMAVKICGVDSIREIELFRMKTDISLEAAIKKSQATMANGPLLNASTGLPQHEPEWHKEDESS